jgi:hypothetical protein
MSGWRRIAPTKIALFTAIGGLSIYLVITRMGAGPDSAAAAPSQTTIAEDSAAAPKTDGMPELTAEHVEAWRATAAMAWPDDPFTKVERFSDPDSESGPASPNPDDKRAFILNAVMKGNPPLAMINGRIVTVGDRIDSAVVEEIGSYSVRLRLHDGVRTVRVVD